MRCQDPPASRQRCLISKLSVDANGTHRWADMGVEAGVQKGCARFLRDSASQLFQRIRGSFPLTVCGTLIAERRDDRWYQLHHGSCA
jgi:hypothetical protein